MHKTIHPYPYEKTNNLTLFSEKSEPVQIFDPCGTFKVNGGHLRNATICGIPENGELSLNSVQSLTVLIFCAQWMCLAALLIWVPEIMSVKIN